MSGIEWIDAPPPVKPARTGGRPPGVTGQFVAELRRNPGRWAVYPTALTHSATGSYNRRYPDIEWAVRKREDGRYDMYARAKSQPPPVGTWRVVDDHELGALGGTS